MLARSPLVSVIVPTLNRPGELGEALASIAAQHDVGASELQVVVVNDGGVDVTDVVARACGGGLAVTAVAHPQRRGLPSARNTGLDLARGRYVAFLDDDDVFLPGHLATALQRLERTVGAAGAVEATVAACLVTEQRAVRAHPVPGAVCWDVPFDPDLLGVCNLLPVHAAVLRHPGRRARFDAALPALEDWDFWLRLTRNHAYRFARLPEPTVIYHRVTTAQSMLNDVVAGARPAAAFSVLVRRIWRRWPARDPRAARFRSYIGTMYWQLLAALATGHVPNPHYYLHSIQAIAAAWTDQDTETALIERLAETVTGVPADDQHAA